MYPIFIESAPAIRKQRAKPKVNKTGASGRVVFLAPGVSGSKYSEEKGVSGPNSSLMESRALQATPKKGCPMDEKISFYFEVMAELGRHPSKNQGSEREHTAWKYGGAIRSAYNRNALSSSQVVWLKQGGFFSKVDKPDKGQPEAASAPVAQPPLKIGVPIAERLQRGQESVSIAHSHNPLPELMEFVPETSAVLGARRFAPAKKEPKTTANARPQEKFYMDVHLNRFGQLSCLIAKHGDSIMKNEPMPEDDLRQLLRLANWANETIRKAKLEKAPDELKEIAKTIQSEHMRYLKLL